jgi:3-oxoadipate enol-lactonase
MLIPYKDYQIYIECYGDESLEPFIMLNGIMMSTTSWHSFYDLFTPYKRVILVDLLDQGKSSKLTGLEYDLSLQVEAVDAVVKTLNLKNISLFGISYGGEVAMKYAVTYPTNIKKLLLFNTTAKTSKWLKEIGHSWNKAASDPYAYYATTIPTIYSSDFYEKKIEWMENRKKKLLEIFANQDFIQAMIRLTNSAEEHDVINELATLDMPTLIVGSEFDTITPYPEQEKLAKYIPNSQLIQVLDSGHASMYEKPMVFTTLILGFLLNDHKPIKI